MKVLVIAFTLLLINQQCVLCQNYTAAVIDYTPKRKPNNFPKDVITDNLNEIKSIVEKVKLKVDIIIFPEFCLTTKEPKYKITDHLKSYSVSLPNTLPSKDNFTDKILAPLSSVAKSKNVYLVTNVIENDENDQFYSTTIVFNRQGSLIAKYRKINLVDERSLSAGNDIVDFETDFNVKIGLMTSYDILFKKPLKELIDNNIKNIIIPMYWSSDLPYIYVKSILDGYSKTHGVNFLVAEYIDSPSNVNPRVRILNIDPNKGRQGKEHYIYGAQFTTPEIQELPKFVIKPLLNDTKEVCESDCCVTYKPARVSNLKDYKMLFFNGDHEFLSKPFSISFCGLMFMSFWDGTQPKNKQIDFETISVAAKYPCTEDGVYLPFTLSDHNSTIYSYEHSCDNGQITMKIDKSDSKLKTFGIFGRIYNSAGTSLISSNMKSILSVSTFYALYVVYVVL